MEMPAVYGLTLAAAQLSIGQSRLMFKTLFLSIFSLVSRFTPLTISHASSSRANCFLFDCGIVVQIGVIIFSFSFHASFFLFLGRCAEFFELISKAQGKRADDQRGLLNKSDLVLPDFLRLADSDNDPNDTDGHRGSGQRRRGNHPHQPLLCSTPADRARGRENGSAFSGSYQSQSLDLGANDSGGRGGPGPRRALMPPSGQRLRRPQGPFPSAFSPVGPSSEARGTPADWSGEGGVSGMGHALEDEESNADLTLVGEGDISSPNSSLLPPHASMSEDSCHHSYVPSAATTSATASHGWTGSGISPV